MKSSILKLFIVIGIIIFSSQSLKASHYMGGEITWECVPAGQPNAGKFIFYLKAYRECNGITFGSTVSLLSNSPEDTIVLNIVSGWPKDISPVCNNDSSFAHITCSGATANNTGAIEEYYYKSNPVQLNGVPPAIGWTFYWQSGNRNPSNNIVNASSVGWYLKAVMYPYNNMNTYPCFDNSPTFAESPQTVICSGYPFTYSQNVFDKELDSLTFEWGEPLVDSTTVLIYTTGYSYASPLPDTTQNSLNVAATIDSSTGTISFTSYTTGAYVTSTKVTSYRCGIKVAEVWREMQVVLLACGTNSPPTVAPPFNNGTSYIDTVYAGENVSFAIQASDFQFLPNGVPQTMNIEAYGSQFGSFIPAVGGALPTFSDTIGCLNPPCATLIPAPGPAFPLTAAMGISTSFNWQTTCGHLATNIGCGLSSNIYNFVFHVADDYCPVPGSNNVTVTIVVLPKPDPMKVKINCISVDPNNDVSIDYSLVEDTLHSFKSYKIYCSDSLNGPYTLVDSINNVNITSYTHLGTAAPKSYYYVATTSVYLVDSVDYTIISDTVRTVKLELTNSGGNMYLSWNSVNINPSSLSKSYIYRRLLNNPQWLLLDSTTSFTYSDNMGDTACGAWYYMVQYSDIANSFNCLSTSNIFAISIIGVMDNNSSEFTLEQNIPNPFNKTTTIRFVSPKNQKFIFSVYDVNGRIIKTKRINANKGNNEFVFSREGLSSGVYIYKLSDGVNTVAKRFVVKE